MAFRFGFAGALFQDDDFISAGLRNKGKSKRDTKQKVNKELVQCNRLVCLMSHMSVIIVAFMAELLLQIYMQMIVGVDAS